MTYRHRRSRPSINLVSLLLAFIGVIIISVAIAGLCFRSWYHSNLRSYSQNSVKVSVTIPPGYTADQIAKLLQSQAVIKNATAFNWYIRFHKLRDKLQAGEYQLDSADTVPEIVRNITRGKVSTSLFTILPAQRLDQISKDLTDFGFSQADVQKALEPAQYNSHPCLSYKPTNATLEGYLYPDSYQTTSNTTVQDIINMSLNQMDKALTTDIIDGIQKQHLTVYQGIILASIVEQEASKSTDRAMIAQVFYNRLSTNMALGSDVTYHYAAAISGQEATPFIDSPYNTRKYSGLPPGPISNISASSLQAVAHPTVNDYLFFVAGDDGTIYFSHTAAEHDALARQYCIILCSTY
jgi:UPF0755 protein